MKKATVVVAILVVGLVGNIIFKGCHSHRLQNATEVNENRHADTSNNSTTNKTQFRCDGRIYCSQMTSCEEATYFLQNCPGVKMDGDNNGVPCEKQWCK
jgi:hypothetical protein